MKLKTDKIVLHSKVVETIYQQMQFCINNIKENFTDDGKFYFRDLQRKLDKGSVDAEVLHVIAQDCASIYHCFGILNNLNIDMDYTQGIRKEKFEVTAWKWSEMVS